MDNTEENQTNESGQALIDIFYKDTYRLNSLISQINNGALQSVITTTDNTQGSVSALKSSLGIPKLASIGTDENTSEVTKQSIQETRNPYDEAILNLLNQLNIHPQNDSLSKIFSQLTIIHGKISLKNYKLFSEIIPLLSDGMNMFDEAIQKKNLLELQVSLLRNKKNTNKEEKALLYDLENQLINQKIAVAPTEMAFKNLHILLPFLPKGIGLEIILQDKTSVTGNLKSEYLVDTEEHIFLNYGENLPDEWNVLGIIDKNNDTNSQSDANNPLSGLSETMSVISTMFFHSSNQFTIIPLLIYRELNI